MAGLRLSSSITEIWGERVLRKNRYGVSFSGPGVEGALKQMGRSGGSLRRRILELLMRNCEIASLVGSSMSTSPNRIHGPVREMPYERFYSGDLSLTFRETNTTKVRKFFSAWQDTIYGRTSGNFNYYENYIGSVEIHQYSDDEQTKSMYGIRLNEVYPKNIHEMSLGYEENNSYQKQVVDFSFRSWDEIPRSELNPTPPPSDAGKFNSETDRTSFTFNPGQTDLSF